MKWRPQRDSNPCFGLEREERPQLLWPSVLTLPIDYHSLSRSFILWLSRPATRTTTVELWRREVLVGHSPAHGTLQTMDLPPI